LREQEFSNMAILVREILYSRKRNKSFTIIQQDYMQHWTMARLTHRNHTILAWFTQIVGTQPLKRKSHSIGLRLLCTLKTQWSCKVKDPLPAKEGIRIISSFFLIKNKQLNGIKNWHACWNEENHYDGQVRKLTGDSIKAISTYKYFFCPLWLLQTNENLNEKKMQVHSYKNIGILKAIIRNTKLIKRY
jgi:hypothetical protein